MSRESLRDRVFGLLYDLCGTSGDVSPDTLRITSHSLLNLADDAGPHVLHDLAGALPWISALVSLVERGANPHSVSVGLCSHGAVRALSEAAVTRRLREAGRSNANTTRRPRGDERLAAHARILKRISQLDASLQSVTMRSERELRRAVLQDVRLLAVAVEICEDAAKTDATARLTESFPYWRTPRNNAASLDVLAGLEMAWNGGVAVSESQLSERARQFELSATENLRSHDVVTAVRAALAFSSCEDPGSGERHLARLPLVEEDPALGELALALARVRGKVLRHVCGVLPLGGLRQWTDYLRGASSEFAEARGLTLRESISFAHYALHLMNFCDLVARYGAEVNDEMRQALLDVEELLKEAALAGERNGVNEEHSDPGRHERLAWQRVGSHAYAADRIARLRGAWREGIAGEADGPLRVASKTFDHSLALLERVGKPALALTSLLHDAELKNVDWFEDLEPLHVVRLLAFGLAAVRDLPKIGVGERFVLDFSGVKEWVREDGGEFRASVLGQLTEAMTLERSLSGSSEPASSHRGLTIAVERGEATVVKVQFVSDAELEAVLTLLASERGADSALREALYQRLYELVRTSGEGRSATREGEAAESKARTRGRLDAGGLTVDT